MKIFECKCGSSDVFIEKNGSQTGLYCDDCGKWIKWINKDEERLVERQIKNHDEKIRDDEIRKFAKWFNRSDYGLLYFDINIAIAEYKKEQIKGGAENDV